MAAKNTVRVLCGTSVRQNADVLRYYLQSLKALKVPSKAALGFAFVDDGAEGGLEGFTVLPGKGSTDVDYAIGVQTHNWSVNAFDRVAFNKQQLMEYAVKEGYDYFFSVDSDLLLEPTTLVNLLNCHSPVVSAVFWTAWQNGGPTLPQVWLRHPYEFQGLGMEPHEFLHKLQSRQMLRVIGGGACTLIHRKVIEAGVGYWPRTPEMPQEGMWQGEDRSFAIKLDRMHIRQYACAFSDIYHAYHPQQRTPETLQSAWERLSAPRQLCAKPGDWVHFTTDPLEEPEFANRACPTSRTHRGRLGAIKVLPELEEALRQMSVGEERLMEIRFPPWYELHHYANKTKAILLKLVDVKPD